MHIKRLLLGWLALLAIFAGLPTLAAPPANISYTVGVCDPNFPQRCQQSGPFVPDNPSTATLAVTTATGRVALPGTGPTVILTNNGSTDLALKLGGSTVTAATTDFLLPSGRSTVIARQTNTYVAAITATSTSSLVAQTGSGAPTFSGGGGSGSSGGGASATAASQGTVAVTAGTNKPVAIDLFSSQSVIVKDVNGAPFDFSAAAPVAGAVTTSAPTYTTGTDQKLSLDTAGNLRVATSGGSSYPADVAATGTINSATSNAAYTVTLANGEGVTAFVVTGLTAAAATLTIEASDDGGTTWSAVNGITPSTGILFSTLTTDQQFRVNTGGRTKVRLRVSSTGSGTITVASNASTVSSAVALSSPVPAGTNVIGHVIADTGSTTAVTGNVATTVADAANVTFGAKADAATCATTNTAMACFRQLHTDVTAAIPAGTNTIGSIAPLAVATTDKSGTITTGGTAQNAIASNASRKGWCIQNTDAAEVMYVRVNGTASATTGTKLVAGAQTCNQVNMIDTAAVSVFAATTAHAWSGFEVQ